MRIRDQIVIKDLEVYCHHGVYKEENVLGQKFLVSVSLHTDTKKAGRSDEISCSVNYAEAAHFISHYMETNTFRLIEAAAEGLAEQLLLRFPSVEAVEAEVKKPWAPILLPLDTVSVKIYRGWNRACLGIGSNLGDKERNLTEAVRLLTEDARCRVESVSDFILTKPVGEVEQDDFLNGALVLKTLREPEELLDLIQEIETKLKRVRTVRWGPRTIDLDILLYENRIVETERLLIPHPQMHRRAFVLEPLVSIAPYAVHPAFGRTAMELKEELDRKET